MVWIEQGSQREWRQARHHLEGKEARVCSEPLQRASSRGERVQETEDEKAMFLE